MGCGGSKEEEKPQQKGKYNDDGEEAPPAIASGQQDHDADLEDDPASHSPLARKESAAVNASEPGDFVAKMKSAYQVRKAKFNGANEDVDQYADEIQDSIPVLARREKARIQEWVNDVGAANPGDVFEEMPADGKQRRTSAVTASSDGNYRLTTDGASDNLTAEPKSPLGLGKQSSSIAAVQSESTQPALESDAGSPKKQTSDAAVAGDDTLPGQVPEQPSNNNNRNHGDAVPLVHVTSGSTTGYNNNNNNQQHWPRRQSDGGMVATMSGLEVSEGASANPEDATHSQGVITDESDVVEGGDFRFS